MVIGADGRKRSHTFHRVLIRSAARLHYEQAQLAVTGRPDEDHRADREASARSRSTPPTAPCCARATSAVRSISTFPERKIVLKSDGTVDRVIMPQRLEAHRLIEEFMILANVAAAETCETRACAADLSRARRAVAGKAQCAARILAHARHLRCRRAACCGRTVSTASCRASKATTSNGWSTKWCCARQAQAEYSSENFGHFGLNLRRYAHFTSPIRRYADLVVHRALIRAGKLGADGQPDGTDSRALAEIAANISATERRAMKAERETADRLIAHFLADRVGATFDGHISGVTRAGLFVELDETGADGFIPARTIGDEYFRFDEAGRAFVGRAVTHRLGDPVTVELVEAAPVAGALRFKLVGHDRAARTAKGLDSRRVSVRNLRARAKVAAGAAARVARLKDPHHAGRRHSSVRAGGTAADRAERLTRTIRDQSFPTSNRGIRRR